MSLKRILLAFFISVFTSLFIFAQAFDLESAIIDEFTLEGDSNVRKWDAFIQQAEGKLTFFGLRVMDLDLLTNKNFYSHAKTKPCNKKKSDKSLLTGDTHNSIKASDFIAITFSLSKVISITKASLLVKVPPTAMLSKFQSNDEILVLNNVTFTPTNLMIYSKGAS